MNEDLEFKDIDEDDEEEVKIPEIHGTKNLSLIHISEPTRP